MIKEKTDTRDYSAKNPKNAKKVKEKETGTPQDEVKDELNSDLNKRPANGASGQR